MILNFYKNKIILLFLYFIYKYIFDLYLFIHISLFTIIENRENFRISVFININ